MNVVIDGSNLKGQYRVNCECGTVWSGVAERDGTDLYSPALPIAESVMHMRLSHELDLLELSFSERFSNWLAKYWDVVSNSTRQLARERAGFAAQIRLPT
jgi:hypothetical protein